MNKYIVIDSTDRDWYNQIGETPYNFVVKFGDNNTLHANVKELFYNISSIYIDKLIMPNRTITNSYNSNSNTKLNDNAFLIIQVDKINNVCNGTNPNTDKCISIMTPYIPISSSISQLEFKNCNGQIKKYSPPKASLDRLEINIKTQSGNNPHNFSDILTINRAYTNNTSITSNTNTIIKLRTSTFFYSNEFQNGDHILIKNYIFRSNTNNECFKFNNFINRNEGHRIIGLTSTNSNTILFNEISIPIPQYYNIITGNLEMEAWYSDFLTKNNFGDIANDNGGKLININLQTRILINIETAVLKN